MDAKKCDRCGNFYEWQWQYEQPNLILKEKSYIIDLCPSCQQKLENFYNYYRIKIEENKEIEQLKEMLNLKQPRKRQYYLDKQDKLWDHYIVDLCCSCGANVYHYEYDGNEIYGVCNACGKDVYVVKKECIDKRLKEGVWK